MARPHFERLCRQLSLRFVISPPEERREIAPTSRGASLLICDFSPRQEISLDYGMVNAWVLNGALCWGEITRYG